MFCGDHWHSLWSQNLVRFTLSLPASDRSANLWFFKFSKCSKMSQISIVLLYLSLTISGINAIFDFFLKKVIFNLFWIFWKIWNFKKKLKFSQKIEIFQKNWNFPKKLKFSKKIEIFKCSKMFDVIIANTCNPKFRPFHSISYGFWVLKI